MTRKIIGALIATLALAAWAVPAAAKTPVFVSILPQKTFVERVGGEHVQVSVLVGPGQSPATYEPTPQQMAALSRAHVLFRIGVPFETSLLGKIARLNPDLRIIDTRRGVTLLPMEADDHDHDHGGMDPHIWLDPQRVKIQAQTIADALTEFDPAHAADFAANLAAFQAELDALDAELAAALAPLRGKKLMVFHPSYGYFAARYGLTQLAVEAAGKSPPPRQIARWIEAARENGVKVIFVQPQFDDRTARAIAEAIDGAVIPLDPLAADFAANLRRIAARIGQALQQ
jgi:zinc transport system substrate-binding protein